MKITIGEYLEKRRKESGLTLDEFSKKIGISKRTYIYIRDGVSVPYGRTLQKVADALDVKIEKLTKLI